MATLGTLMALVMAFPLGVMAARNITPSRTLNVIARLLLVSSRSVNSLVWALLFVAVFGPGALAGTLAIAFRSIGFVGKLVGEALEEAQRGSIEALQAVGAPWASVLARGYWPQVQPAFWSVALFRWDINVRESIVLGLVGAGGVGMVLDNAMNLFFVGARRDGADCDTGRGGLGGDRCDVYPQADYLSGALPLEISMIMRVAR